jgi:hypothetical protein
MGGRGGIDPAADLGGKITGKLDTDPSGERQQCWHTIRTRWNPGDPMHHGGGVTPGKRGWKMRGLE